MSSEPPSSVSAVADAPLARVIDFSGKWTLVKREGDEAGFLRLLGISEFRITMNGKASEKQYIMHFLVDGVHILRRRVDLKVLGYSHTYHTYEIFDGKTHPGEDDSKGFGPHECKSKMTRHNECRVVRIIQKDGRRLIMQANRLMLDADTALITLSIQSGSDRAQCIKTYTRDKMTSSHDFDIMSEMSKGHEPYIYRG